MNDLSSGYKAFRDVITYFAKGQEAHLVVPYCLLVCWVTATSCQRCCLPTSLLYAGMINDWMKHDGKGQRKAYHLVHN
jgi:hypothetical protein